MKSIKSKFHLNITVYFFFLISFLCGYFKQTFYLFFIVIFHELGHILAILFFKYKFLRVDIYPFGGITRIDKPVNSSINKEIVIASSGVFAQILLFLIAFCFKDFIDYKLFCFYNITLICFNLLPIIPLDGSIIFHSFLEKLFSYQKAYHYFEIFSCFAFFLFVLGNIIYEWNNYFICFVLLYLFFKCHKEKKYLIHRFYLERFLKGYPYKKIESHQKEDITVLKKETLHFFFRCDHYVLEREVLKDYFVCQNHLKKE